MIGITESKGFLLSLEILSLGKPIGMTENNT